MSQEELESCSNKLDELIRNFKPPYSWIHHKAIMPIILVVVWMSFSLFVIGPYYKKAGILKVSEQIIINQSLSFIIGLVFGWGLTKLLPFFFPESFFLIGRQKLFHDKKKRLRHTIGTVILLGIAASLVGAFIFSKISQ